MKLDCTLEVTTTEQLARVFKLMYKYEMPITIPKSFDYFYLLYQAIEQELLAPEWFSCGKLQTAIEELLQFIRDNGDEKDIDHLEQIKTIYDFMDEISVLNPKVKKAATIRETKLYKVSGELKAILGSEWLIRNEYASLETIKSFIEDQIVKRGLKRQEGKIWLDEYCKSMLGTGEDWMYKDQMLRRLKSGLDP